MSSKKLARKLWTTIDLQLIIGEVILVKFLPQCFVAGTMKLSLPILNTNKTNSETERRHKDDSYGKYNKSQSLHYFKQAIQHCAKGQ